MGNREENMKLNQTHVKFLFVSHVESVGSDRWTTSMHEGSVSLYAICSISFAIVLRIAFGACVCVMCSLVLGLEIMILLLAPNPLQTNWANQTHNWIMCTLYGYLVDFSLKIPRGNFSAVIVEEAEVDKESRVVLEFDDDMSSSTRVAYNLYHCQSDRKFFAFFSLSNNAISHEL